MRKYKIFIAPLDWGLGHATRCIPIINYMIKQNIEVIVGANGKIAELFLEEFPGLQVIPITNYRIKYSQNPANFLMTILLQFPKILHTIWKENRQIKKIVKDCGIDAIISDNRLGCFHKKIPSIFITHQLQILTGKKWLDFFALRVNYFFINQFCECWVPDFEGEDNLTGHLSRPDVKPKIPVKYIGSLSRFTFTKLPIKIPLTILISGPEPQRSIFEQMIIAQTKDIQMPILIIRGLPGKKELPKSTNQNIEFHNHLNAASLGVILQQSNLIIARSGYTTIMDLLALQKNAILIPTPGQTEQEYLGKIVHEKRLFYTVSQANFNLKDNIREIQSHIFEQISQHSFFENHLKDWLKNN